MFIIIIIIFFVLSTSSSTSPNSLPNACISFYISKQLVLVSTITKQTVSSTCALQCGNIYNIVIPLVSFSKESNLKLNLEMYCDIHPITLCDGYDYIIGLGIADLLTYPLLRQFPSLTDTNLTLLTHSTFNGDYLYGGTHIMSIDNYLLGEPHNIVEVVNGWMCYCLYI